MIEKKIRAGSATGLTSISIEPEPGKANTDKEEIEWKPEAYEKKRT